MLWLYGVSSFSWYAWDVVDYGPDHPGPWVTLDYRLPPRAERRWHTIRLTVTPTWKVPGDDRVLGVVIGEWTVEE